MKSAHLKAISEQITRDILQLKDVQGVMLFTATGELLFKKFAAPATEKPNIKQWTPFINALSDIQEAELVFDHLRLYIRSAEIGFLIVIMKLSASVSLMRLHCDVLLPSLTSKKSKGIFQFFKK